MGSYSDTDFDPRNQDNEITRQYSTHVINLGLVTIGVHVVC